MTNSIIFLITLVFTIHVSAEFSDRIRKTSAKLFPLVDSEVNDNFVISPFSIFNLLTSVSIAASGESKKQIKQAFYLPKNTKLGVEGNRKLEETLKQPSDGVAFLKQNFMFIDESLQLNEKYNKKIVQSSSGKPRNIVRKLDFTSNLAANQANSIIESVVNISNVLSPDNLINSKMVLTNVMSFKGYWSFPFNESDTTVETFYDKDSNEIGKVNMMYQKFECRFSNMQSLNASILELPYGNDKSFCMLVVLPFPHISVREVYKNFESVTYEDIFNQLQSDEDEFGAMDAHVKLPRFKISTNIILNKPLNSMGVVDIFEPGRANFKKITKDEIFISEVVHKADIEVTESGTVASAVTSAHFSFRGAEPEFTASRPFIFLILEKNTRSVFFTGIYSEPSLF